MIWIKAYLIVFVLILHLLVIPIIIGQESLFIDENTPIFDEKKKSTTLNPHSGKFYSLIHNLFHIGVNNPDELVRILLNSDPLGVKVKSIKDFQCDNSTQLPQNMNMSRLQDFREGRNGSYIIFQHIRKAGGTGFCRLAEKNIVSNQEPDHFACRGSWHASLASISHDNYSDFQSYMTTNTNRLAMNEWDKFFDFFFDYEGAITATSLRDPLSRWYSLYVFEHLEYHVFAVNITDKPGDRRDPFMVWYERTWSSTLGKNYYIKSFIGQNFSPAVWQAFHNRAQVNNSWYWYWTYQVLWSTPITWDLFHDAVLTLSQFSLLLIMEWMSEPETASYMQRELGWTKPPFHFRPLNRAGLDYHVDYAKLPSLQDATTKEEYLYLARDNVLDMLFYYVARRMFLERVKCNPPSPS